MYIEPFEMERFQSVWENEVEYNLSESGVHPLKIHNFITLEDFKNLAMLPLGYNQTNGSEELRTTIADMYPGAIAENVLVTTGSCEANFLSIWSFIEPGNEVALMLPNYMQIWGAARAFGADVKPFHLVPDQGRWQIDWDEFERSVTPKTKLIAVCNPNNPTGAQLNQEEIERICNRAAEVDAWILADEVYRGAERTGDTISPTFWGNYDKVIITCGLSKAYGLPGLRIGWIVTRPDSVESIWSYHDYTTICPNPISDFLARIALLPENREFILERARSIVWHNFKIMRKWLQSHKDLFEYIPPVAGAIVLVKYNLNISSMDLVNGLRDEKSVLVVPGEHFFMEKCLRFGIGDQPDYLQQALDRIGEYIEKITES